MRLEEALQHYRFLTYSRDQEQGGAPLYALMPEAQLFQTPKELEDWYQRKQSTVMHIANSFESVSAIELSDLCTKLEQLFTKNVLKKVLPDATDATLDMIEQNRILFSQLNLLPYLLALSNGVLENINHFLVNQVLKNPNLIKEFDLSDCHQLTDPNLLSIRTAFPHLQKIHLKNCYFLTKASLFTLSELEQLDFLTLPLGVFESLTPEELDFLTFKNLKYLGFGDHHIELPPVAFSWIKKLPALMALDLSRAAVTPSDLAKLPKNLQVLILDDHTFNEKEQTIASLAKLNTTTISLQRTNFNQADILKLITLSNENFSPEEAPELFPGSRLHTIIVDSDYFPDEAFLEACANLHVSIESGHRHDDSFDSSSLGSSYEEESRFGTYYMNSLSKSSAILERADSESDIF